MSIRFKALLALPLTLALGTDAKADNHAGAVGYGLVNQGKTLAVMADLAKPTDIKTFDLAEPLAAIAYRPVTGDLLGFSNGKVVTIDVASGKMTDLGATFADDAKIGAGAKVGFDFNNKIDAVRVVSSKGDNLVYFPVGFGKDDPKANSVRRFTNLAYEKGDANAGATPMIFANAYTNAINGKKAGGTFQYAIDAGTNALVSLANNEGTLKTIGTLKIGGNDVDVTTMGGFDIISPAEGTDQAFAVLQLEGQDAAGLYGIDLMTAEATLIAGLGMGGFEGFAVSKAKN